MSKSIHQFHHDGLLAPSGQLIAVLPAGCLRNDRDQLAWELLGKLCLVEFVGENGHNTFSGCSPRTIVARFTKTLPQERPEDSVENATKATATDIVVKVVRGRLSINTLNGNHSDNMRPLVHSTELEIDGLNLSRRKADGSLMSISGPTVLLPRVGRPNKLKVHTYIGRRRIILSDCVIALKCGTAEDAAFIKKSLVENWSEVERDYVGTCARHITVGSISQLLKRFGFVVETSNGSRHD